MSTRVVGIGGIFFKARDPERFGWVADPEGNRLELWEPPKQSGDRAEGRPDQ